MSSNIFAGWEPNVSEPEAHAAGPVRVIPITPELIAADQAAQATRRPGLDHKTWTRPEPIGERAYSFPAGRSDGKRRSTKNKEGKTK